MGASDALVQACLERLRRGCGDIDRRLRGGQWQDQTPGMEGERAVGLVPTIEDVAKDRQAEMGEVDPDLMGPPGLWVAFQEADPVLGAVQVQRVRAGLPAGSTVTVQPLRWLTLSRGASTVPLSPSGTPRTRAQ